jgi:hypothetical protein
LKERKERASITRASAVSETSGAEVKKGSTEIKRGSKKVDMGPKRSTASADMPQLLKVLEKKGAVLN